MASILKTLRLSARFWRCIKRVRLSLYERTTLKYAQVETITVSEGKRFSARDNALLGKFTKEFASASENYHAETESVGVCKAQDHGRAR